MKEALLVIDVQNDVVKHAFNREQVILNIHSLVQKARLHQIPVIWIQHEDDELKHGSNGWQIVEALKPLTEENRIYKTWSNAFIDTPLKAVLAQQQIDTVVLVGAQSEFCLRMSKHGALEQGFHVVWVEDAHTTEDADDEGVKFSGESIVAWENRMAHSTSYQRAQCRCLLSKDLWST